MILPTRSTSDVITRSKGSPLHELDLALTEFKNKLTEPIRRKSGTGEGRPIDIRKVEVSYQHHSGGGAEQGG